MATGNVWTNFVGEHHFSWWAFRCWRLILVSSRPEDPSYTSWDCRPLSYNIPSRHRTFDMYQFGWQYKRKFGARQDTKQTMSRHHNNIQSAHLMVWYQLSYWIILPLTTASPFEIYDISIWTSKVRYSLNSQTATSKYNDELADTVVSFLLDVTTLQVAFQKADDCNIHCHRSHWNSNSLAL